MNTIEFRIHYIGGKFISLIRELRRATGSDILRVKTLVQASQMGPGPVLRVTAEQYGNFIAGILASHDVELKEVRMSDMRVFVGLDADPYDFTAARPALSAA